MKRVSKKLGATTVIVRTKYIKDEKMRDLVKLLSQVFQIALLKLKKASLNFDALEVDSKLKSERVEELVKTLDLMTQAIDKLLYLSIKEEEISKIT